LVVYVFDRYDSRRVDSTCAGGTGAAAGWGKSDLAFMPVLSAQQTNKATPAVNIAKVQRRTVNAAPVAMAKSN
jgi:hypothetical protein